MKTISKKDLAKVVGGCGPYGGGDWNEWWERYQEYLKSLQKNG